MANLSVRKLDEETLAHLLMCAASHGVSMEEEARQIPREAVSAWTIPRTPPTANSS